MADNTLYYGDNLDVLRHHVSDESVDLVYLDSPFNSNATYNVLFAAQDGTRSAAQIKAFGDTWRWDQAAAYDYQQTVEAGGQVSQAMQAFHTLLGPSNMLALPRDDGSQVEGATSGASADRIALPPLRSYGESLLEAAT
jgi:site-specific DNA-methyltransferase (adenine-specific)